MVCAIVEERKKFKHVPARNRTQGLGSTHKHSNNFMYAHLYQKTFKDAHAIRFIDDTITQYYHLSLLDGPDLHINTPIISCGPICIRKHSKTFMPSDLLMIPITCWSQIVFNLRQKSGYWQVEKKEAGKAKSDFHVGSVDVYKCNQMLFGLCNAPAIFTG